MLSAGGLRLPVCLASADLSLLTSYFDVRSAIRVIVIEEIYLISDGLRVLLHLVCDIMNRCLEIREDLSELTMLSTHSMWLTLPLAS